MFPLETKALIPLVMQVRFGGEDVQPRSGDALMVKKLTNKLLAGAHELLQGRHSSDVSHS